MGWESFYREGRLPEAHESMGSVIRTTPHYNISLSGAFSSICTHDVSGVSIQYLISDHP